MDTINIFSMGPIQPTIEEFVEQLKINHVTLSTAESLTGGLIGAEITKIPGISEFYKGGVIVYSNELKNTILGVSEKLLQRFGPYNSTTTDQMANGVCSLTRTSASIAVSGVAGPSPDQGVEPGTVYITVKVNNMTMSAVHHFSGTRTEVRKQTVAYALGLFYDCLSGEGAYPF